MKHRTSYKRLAGGCALWSAILLVLASPAWAVLGDNASSVLRDQARMKGNIRSVDNRGYVMHEISTSAGDKVREYVTPGGAVFGVAWEGQLPPNLQDLLGPYYQQAKQARQSAQKSGDTTPRMHRAPVVIDTPSLVLYQGGHIRNFHGVAYIPQLIPQGVQASEIH